MPLHECLIVSVARFLLPATAQMSRRVTERREFGERYMVEAYFG